MAPRRLLAHLSPHHAALRYLRDLFFPAAKFTWPDQANLIREGARADGQLTISGPTNLCGGDGAVAAGRVEGLGEGGSSRGRRAVVVHMLLLLLGVTWGRGGDLLAPQDSQYDHLLETLLPSAPPRPRHPRRREGKEALGNNSRGRARRPHPRRGRQTASPRCASSGQAAAGGVRAWEVTCED